MNRDEKILWIIVRSVIGIIFTLFMLGIFGVIGEPCTIDKASLNCAVKPFSIGDLIGSILIICLMYFLAFGAKPFVKEDLYMKPNSLGPILAIFAAGVLGVILIFTT